MFRTLSLFWKLTDDHLHTFPPVPPLTNYILSDSQLGGLGHGNSPDETTKFNLKVQLQRKKKNCLLGDAFSIQKQETNYKKTHQQIEARH